MYGWIGRILFVDLTAGRHEVLSIAKTALITTAAAIANAIHDAVGVWIHDLPITPEKVLKAIRKKTGAECSVKTF